MFCESCVPVTREKEYYYPFDLCLCAKGDCMRGSTLLNISQMLMCTVQWTNLCHGLAEQCHKWQHHELVNQH